MRRRYGVFAACSRLWRRKGDWLRQSTKGCTIDTADPIDKPDTNSKGGSRDGFFVVHRVGHHGEFQRISGHSPIIQTMVSAEFRDGISGHPPIIQTMVSAADNYGCPQNQQIIMGVLKILPQNPQNRPTERLLVHRHPSHRFLRGGIL